MSSDDLSADLASLRIDRDDDGPPRRWPRYVAVLVTLAVIALLVYKVALPRLEARFFRTEVEVTAIALVSPAQASVLLSATGYVIPQLVSKVAAQIQARVTAVLVKEGDRVEQGAAAR